MQSFYLEYPQKSNLQSVDVENKGTNLAPMVREIEGKSLPPLVAEISWSKLCVIPEKYRLQAKLAVKDEYNFDFIEMGIEHSEAELEAGIINNIRSFLSELLLKARLLSLPPYSPVLSLAAGYS